MRRRSNSAQLSFNNSSRNASRRRAPSFTPAHSGLAEARMDNLLMGTLHGTAADPLAQSQILVIAPAPGILTVVTDERLQALAQLRRFRPQPLQPGDYILHLSGRA